MAKWCMWRGTEKQGYSLGNKHDVIAEEESIMNKVSGTNPDK